MRLTRERLDEIEAAIFRGGEDDNFELVPSGAKGHYPCYFVTPTRVLYFPKDSDDFTEMSETEFLREVANKELSLEIFVGRTADGKEIYNRYDTDDEVNEALGISKMVVISTKVPSIIAKRFRMFAEEANQSTASKLRHLVYNFVEQEFKESAGSLMFRADI